MKYHFLIVLFIIISFFSCTENTNTEQKKNEHKDYSFRQFSKTDLKKDLIFLFNKLDSTHFNLYHKHSKEDFEYSFNKLKEGIQDSMNLFEFYYYILPLYGMLDDAHSSLIFPFEYTIEFSNQGGKIIPLEVEIENGHIYIIKNHSQQVIPNYSEIISINNISSKEIIESLEKLINNERQYSEEKYMARFFNKILFPLYGFDKHYSVTIKSTDGIKSTIELDGVSMDVFQKNKDPFYSYYSIGDSIGVMDINLCEERDEFASFCDSVFTILQTKEIPNLVIDLRDNGGGSTFHGDTLFTYIYDKKFTQYGPVKMKISPMINSKLDSTYIEEYESQSENSYFNPKRFKGEIYMIVNENSFSSAAMMAATFKCYKMGKLIGRETGGVEIFYDEPIMFSMPITGIRFLVSYQYRWCACGKNPNHGIIPDYISTWNINDKINGIDTEMEIVKEHIKNQSTTKSK